MKTKNIDFKELNTNLNPDLQEVISFVMQASMSNKDFADLPTNSKVLHQQFPHRSIISQRSSGHFQIEGENAIQIENFEVKEPPFVHKNQFENVHGAKFKTIDNKSKMQILDMMSPVFKMPEINNNDIGLSLSPTRYLNNEFHSLSPQQLRPSPLSIKQPNTYVTPNYRN